APCPQPVFARNSAPMQKVVENTEQILRSTAHRPWSLPSGPWVMRHPWRHLLFAHWPVTAQSLRPIVPPELPIDEFDGSAWVGIIPFWMSGVRARLVPPVPTASIFPEL